MFKTRKDDDIEISRPLKHRPEVVVVKHQDGRRKIFGDGNAFTAAESLLLHGEPLTGGEFFAKGLPQIHEDLRTADELAEIEKIEVALADARQAHGLAEAACWGARDRVLEAESEGTGVAAARAALADAERKCERTETKLRQALVARTATRRRIDIATRDRLPCISNPFGGRPLTASEVASAGGVQEAAEAVEGGAR